MRLLSSSAILWLVSFPLSATSFTKTYGGPEVDRGVSVALTGDRGCDVTGYTAVQGAGKLDAFLHKLDANWE